MEEKCIIAVMGPTGCGKSTLIKEIERANHCILVWEEWQNNPYIIDSYEEKKNEYKNQLWFIKNDINRTTKAISRKENVIIDKLFIQNYAYLDNPLFSNQEKKELKGILDSNIDLLKDINSIILFDIPTCEILNRIRKRGRVFEQTISYEWIDNLNNIIYQLAHFYSDLYKIRLIYCDKFNIIKSNGEIIEYVKLFL